MGQNNHSGHWGITPLFLAKPPPLNQETFQVSPPPFLGNLPFYIGFSRPPPSKSDLSVNPEILKSFVLNTILSFKSN